MIEGSFRHRVDSFNYISFFLCVFFTFWICLVSYLLRACELPVARDRRVGDPWSRANSKQRASSMSTHVTRMSIHLWIIAENVGIKCVQFLLLWSNSNRFKCNSLNGIVRRHKSPQSCYVRVEDVFQKQLRSLQKVTSSFLTSLRSSMISSESPLTGPAAVLPGREVSSRAGTVCLPSTIKMSLG